MITNRKFGVGVLILTLLLVSMVFVDTRACSENNHAETAISVSDKAKYAATSTCTITPDTPGLSEKEFNVYVDKMKQKYGDAGVFGIEPNVTIKGEYLGHYTNLHYVNAWTEHLEVKDDSGTVLASSNNSVALYKLDTTDELGREHYYYWQWSSAQNREDTNYLGDASNLRNFWNKVTLNSSSYDLLIYSPDTDITQRGVPITVYLLGDGVTCGISGQFVLNEGKVRPKPGECQVGSKGKYTVEWIGDYEGCQAINGVCEERRPYGSSENFNWKISLTASQY
jgi:hypothetical protein